MPPGWLLWVVVALVIGPTVLAIIGYGVVGSLILLDIIAEWIRR